MFPHSSKAVEVIISNEVTTGYSRNLLHSLWVFTLTCRWILLTHVVGLLSFSDMRVAVTSWLWWQILETHWWRRSLCISIYEGMLCNKLSMYSYCCLCTCILIVRPCILNVVYVSLLLSMYSYCCLCILIVRPCILIVVYVYLLLSMYSQTRLPWLRFFRAFSSVVRQMAGYN
jgi:hypothetical protein